MEQRQNYCSGCQIQFANPVIYKRHVDHIHDKKCNEYCVYCWKGFGDKSRLKVHTQQKHNTNEIYECWKCQRKFEYWYPCKTHISGCRNYVLE